MLKVNLGCGDNRLPGWQNHDADVDVTKPLPWGDSTVDFLLIEHCVEHVGYYQAIAFFKEVHRVLRPGGVLRVIVPSITQIMNCGHQPYFDWLKKQGWAPTADDRGAMHAILFQHGHQQAWTATLMEATLYYSGFDEPMRADNYVSRYEELHNVDGHHKAIGDEFNRIESLVFEATKAVTMPRDLASDYDASFYAMHQPWRAEYENMANILKNHLPPFKSVVDIGCGNGYLISALEQLDIEVAGVDGSPNVLKYRPDALVVDITQPFNMLPHDLVICTEVAEHIEERYADMLVEKLCAVARDTIFFSAAVAGHGGHHHVNEQPREYWYAKFASRGFEMNEYYTNVICQELQKNNKQTWWFAKNCFVLRRTSPQLALNLRAPSWHRRVAVVVGGAECVWDDLALARQMYDDIEYFVTNDTIPLFDGPMTACTLHPDKLNTWIAQRRNNGFSTPLEIWSHDQSKSAQYNLNIQTLRDWGGSSGLFAVQVAIKKGHDRIVLCGVPMNNGNHFVRKSKWTAVSAFTRAWESHKKDIEASVRSFSGWTADLLGKPTLEWIK